MKKNKKYRHVVTYEISPPSPPAGVSAVVFKRSNMHATFMVVHPRAKSLLQCETTSVAGVTELEEDSLPWAVWQQAGSKPAATGLHVLQEQPIFQDSMAFADRNFVRRLYSQMMLRGCIILIHEKTLAPIAVMKLPWTG